jgi:hypothetical protein
MKIRFFYSFGSSETTSIIGAALNLSQPAHLRFGSGVPWFFITEKERLNATEKELSLPTEHDINWFISFLLFIEIGEIHHDRHSH